ncbi:MAG: M43 family zinc metalloprotease [Saprospiraceae bacterium]
MVRIKSLNYLKIFTNTRWVLTECLILFLVFCKAQPICDFDFKHNKLYSENAIYKQSVDLLQKRIYDKTLLDQNLVNNHTAQIKNYTLPIVIHLIVPPGTPIGSGANLTDLQVEQGLELLNDSYANRNAFNTSDGIDVGIQFCLAKRDPNGMPTNGITRDESILVNDPMCSPGTNSSSDGQIKQIVNWNCRQYINIWLVTDLFNGAFGCSLAGFAYFPGAPCSVDGIVQEARYWNSKGGTVVTAHEMGHYFALHHTFNGGCTNNNCLLDGDQVCDTPPDNSSSFAACNTNSCNTDSPDLVDDNTNYMDYTSCSPPHFTKGQSDRMINALEMSRSGLINSNACLPVADLDIRLLDFNVPNAICGDSLCPEIQFRNEGLKTIQNFTIELYINNVLINQINWLGPLLIQEKKTLSLPCVKLAKGSFIVEIRLTNPNGLIDAYPVNNIFSKTVTIYDELITNLSSVTPTHCVSDGTVTVNSIGGTSPYIYGISSKSTLQNSPFFQLLLSGNHQVYVEDANGCKDTLNLNIPDSCSSAGNKKFITNNNARHLGNDCYLLTEEKTTQAGSVWYEDKIDLNSDFDINFQINLGCLDQNGADGIAFVLQPISTAIGVSGGGMGYQNVKPSLAVEFDTWQNREYGDPFYDHVAVIRNGNIDHRLSDNLAGPAQILPAFGNIEDCKFHNGIIRWQATKKKLDVYLDCRLIISYQGDVVQSIFGGDPRVFFGFTAGTGGSVNTQQICLNYVSTVNKLKDEFICSGESIQISAISKFKNYKWKPTIGINNPGVFNPVFSPDSTTKYFLEFSDNCNNIYFDSLTIFVKKVKLNYDLSASDSCSSNSNVLLLIQQDTSTPNAIYSIDGVNFNYNREYVFQRPSLNTLYMKIGSCIVAELIDLRKSNPILQDSLIFYQAVTCREAGRFMVSGMGGYPPYRYRINSAAWQSSGLFESLPSGLYTVDIQDSIGCIVSRQISIDNFVSSLKLKEDSSSLIKTCCTPEAFVSVHVVGSVPLYYYSLNGDRWTNENSFRNLSSGFNSIYARDEFGCVSDTLTYMIIDNRQSEEDTLAYSMCKGDSIRVGTNVYFQTGFYKDVFLNQYCCDSLVFTDLKVGEVYNQFISEQICNGEQYIIGNKTYSSTGIFVDTLSTISSCDSVIHLDLKVLPVYSRIDNPAICQGDFRMVGNKIYTTAGNYIDTLITQNGCDSIVITNLVINSIQSQQSSIQICEGELWSVGNNNYKTSGNFIDSLLNVNGCDSVITTQLTVFPKFAKDFEYAKCAGEFVTVGTKNYTQTGIYEDSLQSTHGCDSIIRTKLFIDTLEFEVSMDSIFCFGINDGRLELKVIKGLLPFGFSWNGKKYFGQEIVIDQIGPGNYFLKLEDSLHCTKEIAINFIEPMELMSELDATINLNIGETTILKPILNFVPSKIQWLPTSGLSCDNCLNPTVNVLKNSTYEVVFTDQYGCEIRARVNILIDNDADIYVPNVFSPNDDLVNDKITVFGGPGIDRVLTFQIFDRWGEMVFEALDFPVNELNYGWDGNFNHNKLNPGVFVYLAKAIRIDGTIIQKYGDISLLR